MKAQVAACICLALTQPCLGDETLFTCKDGTQQSYIAEGGHDKPGWSTNKSGGVIKLLTTDLAKTGSFFDIEVTTKYGNYSSLKDFLHNPRYIRT